jgi:hypothetical protein
VHGEQYKFVFPGAVPPRKPTAEELQRYKLELVNHLCNRMRRVIRLHPLPEFNPVVELIERIRAEATRDLLETDRS